MQKKVFKLANGKEIFYFCRFKRVIKESFWRGDEYAMKVVNGVVQKNGEFDGCDMKFEDKETRKGKMLELLG